MTRALILTMPDIYQTWHENHILGPTLAGPSLAANAPNHDIYSADLILRRKDVRAGVEEALAIVNPEFVGLSAMTFQFPTAVRIARYLKSNQPSLKIAIGGYHATAERETMAQSPEGMYFDFIFAGEAEKTFAQFLDGADFKDIKGFSYKNRAGQWVHNPRHPAISRSQGLDSLNSPNRDSRIWGGYHFHNRPFDTAESSRGCDYACTFCSMRSMMPNARFVPYNLDRVIADLKRVKKSGVRSVFFTDDNPAMNAELFRIFLERTIQEGLNDIFYSGMLSTERMADKDLTKLMRRAGWDFVFLGIENIYTTNLKSMRKKSDEKLAERAIESLYEAGITNLPGLVLGNPDDTEETIRGNMQWLRQFPIDGILPQFITPYPGTEDRKKLLVEGLVINPGGMHNEYGGWSTYNGEFAHCRTRSGLMPAQIETIVYEEIQEFLKARTKNILKGHLNILRNNPFHLFKVALHETIPVLSRSWERRSMNTSQQAASEIRRKRAMNIFDI